MVKLTETSISPQDIIEKLDEVIVGQQHAKETIATALYLHFISYLQSQNGKEPYPKAHTLLIGPSGNGKTFLVKNACRIMQELTYKTFAPIIEIDCTALSVEGWAGPNMSDYLTDHLSRYSGDEIALNTAVLYFDEFDKLCIPAVSSGGTDMHKQVQYSLLKVIEGFNYMTGSNIGFSSIKSANTTGFLCVFSGNFAEYREAQDKGRKGSIGFNNNIESNDELKMESTLQKVGLATQLLGRISKITEITRLTKEELMDIIRQNILPNIEALSELLKFDINITNEDIEGIADEAIKNKTGARGLKSEMEKLLQDKILPTRFNYTKIDKEKPVKTKSLLATNEGNKARVINAYYIDGKWPDNEADVKILNDVGIFKDKMEEDFFDDIDITEFDEEELAEWEQFTKELEDSFKDFLEDVKNEEDEDDDEDK